MTNQQLMQQFIETHLIGTVSDDIVNSAIELQKVFESRDNELKRGLKIINDNYIKVEAM